MIRPLPGSSEAQKVCHACGQRAHDVRTVRYNSHHKHAHSSVCEPCYQQLSSQKHVGTLGRYVAEEDE